MSEEELQQELAQFDWVPASMDKVFSDVHAFQDSERDNIQWHQQEKAG